MNEKATWRLRVLCLCIAVAPLACRTDPKQGVDGRAQSKASAPSSASAASSSAPAASTSAVARQAVKDQRPQTALNVILLTIDGLRADMPWTGYHQPIAERLTRLANEGIVYENQRAISSSSLQSLAVVLSGRFPSTLNRTQQGYLESNDWLAQVMLGQKVVTLSVQSSSLFEDAPWIKQGFSEYQWVPGSTTHSVQAGRMPAEAVIAQSMRLLNNPLPSKGTFFFWSHWMAPDAPPSNGTAAPSQTAPNFGNDERGRYDTQVWEIDRWIARLLDFCEKQAWWEHTVLIVSGDRGHALGEANKAADFLPLGEERVRVPLILRAPGAVARRIRTARTHLDLAPTILELMKVAVPFGMQGQSMVPEIYGEEMPIPRETIALELMDEQNQSKLRAVVDGDYKLVSMGKSQGQSLYQMNHTATRQELLTKEKPEHAKALSEKLRVYFAKLPESSPSRTAHAPRAPSSQAPTTSASANPAPQR